jgi:diacylglycerol kinase family enzyme
MRQFTLIQLFKMLWSYRNFNPKKVEIIEATKATITTKRETHFQVDGEFKGKKNRVEAQIIPAGLNLLLPEFE